MQKYVQLYEVAFEYVEERNIIDKCEKE